jgi:ribose/xylose/arabinose/galactoside ABC-type transport system permease subunit
VAAGALIGLLNGFLVAVCNIIPLITTIGTMYIFRGFCEMIMTSSLAMSLMGFPQSFLDFGSMRILGLYPMMWIMIILLVAAEIVLKRTYLGRQLYYIGGNQSSARSLGFNVKAAVIICFVISGTLSALAGVVSIARFQSASRYLGQGLQMDILIACIIGGGSLMGGKGDMKGAFFGTAFVALLENAFNLFEINSLFKSVVVGAALVLVVLFDGYVHLKKMRELGRV